MYVYYYGLLFITERFNSETRIDRGSFYRLLLFEKPIKIILRCLIIAVSLREIVAVRIFPSNALGNNTTGTPWRGRTVSYRIVSYRSPQESWA